LKTSWLIIFILLLQTVKPVAQVTGNNNIVLYSITEANGLSDDHVQCVLKDKRGFVWIGTSDGLNLMDGSSITIYRHSDADSASLISSDIHCLAEDTSYNIWIGTPDGLSCFSEKKENFISAAPPGSPYGNSHFINAIVVDKKNRVWCSTDGGLFLFDPDSHSFQHYYINSRDDGNRISLSNKLTHIICDKRENKLWISSADGLWSFDLDNLNFKKEISALNDYNYQELFTYVFESNDGKIWAGNWGNGLELLDQKTKKVFHYVDPHKKIEVVKCINEIKQADGRSILWLDGKLQAFDPFSKQFFNYSMPSQSQEIPEMRPCYKSSDGWMWLSSSSGLYIYNPQHQFFQHKFFANEITTQDVLFKEWNNRLIVGGQGKNFLKIYDDHWNLKKDLGYLVKMPDGGNKNQVNAATLTLSIRNKNIFWIGSSEGLVKLNVESGKARWFRHVDGDSNTLPRNFITYLFFDSQNKLWLFPWRGGIWMMDTATGRCFKMWSGFAGTNGKVKNLVIASATEDKNGNIWMADLDQGIISYNRKENRFSIPFEKELGKVVHTQSVFYKNGFLYSATNHYLLRWNQDSMQPKKIELPPQMNKEIYDLRPDQRGNWWILTKNGLVVYNEAANIFRRFTTADGLLNNDMDGTLFCRNDGTMLFGNRNFITSFDPAKFLSAIGDVSPVQLNEILSNNNPVMQNGNGSLKFHYPSRNIIFRWTLPDFSSPLHNQYYCKLQGIDTGWRYVGNSGQIEYASLSPGKYNVQLKAASANGVAAPNVISIPFEVLPPFWKRSWFLAGASLAIILIFGFIVRYISQRNLKEKLLQMEKDQAVERERNRISRDMHDDLGSGLTKIAIMSEVVKKQLNEPEKAKQQLEKISTSSRELVDNLQDIIWILNPKNDTLDNLAAYVREHALQFFEPFETEVHFNYPSKFPDIRLSEEQRRNIFLTVKETFNNIAKHAWCNHVTIGISCDRKNIVILIQDDGKGFDVDKVRPFANGLISMQHRIEQIGGRFLVQSGPGEGTSTEIIINL
jgi:signal transduction histidine kinase/ligand-binding sensor domain-containing protein